MRLSGNWLKRVAFYALLPCLLAGLARCSPHPDPPAPLWRGQKWGVARDHANVTLLSAIVLHGLWNAVSLATGVASLVVVDSQPTIWQDLLYSAPTFILLLISITGMAWIKKYFIRQNHHDDSDSNEEQIDLPQNVE